jgi:hypothetical protein
MVVILFLCLQAQKKHIARAIKKTRTATPLTIPIINWQNAADYPGKGLSISV